MKERTDLMTTKCKTLTTFSATCFVVAASLAFAGGPYGPGVSDTEIKIGQTMPYSGPASAWGTIGKAEAAYFKMVNDWGGVNGRKINLISLDDGYSPPKTVEQTRQLIEHEQVAFIFGTLGGVTNLAIRQYLNDNRIPQLFLAAAADIFADPRFPWTMGLNPALVTEAHIYAKHIRSTNANAKIGVLFQNDVLGKPFLAGLREGLGPEGGGMVVKEASYEVSDPTVDSQIVALQGSGADTLVIAAAPKPAAQAIRKAHDIGWTPQRYLFSGSASIIATLKPAGLDKSNGVITGVYEKDPSDPRWKDDPGYREFAAFVTKYMSETQLRDPVVAYGFLAATLMTHVLKQCGDDLSRENILRQATNIRDFELPMGLAGTRVNTSPENYFPIRQLQLSRFNGENWVPFGDLMSD
jgi:ABC-type branched-subunit amino acid transport system substrate-binding protein